MHKTLVTAFVMSTSDLYLPYICHNGPCSPSRRSVASIEALLFFYLKKSIPYTAKKSSEIITTKNKLYPTSPITYLLSKYCPEFFWMRTPIGWAFTIFLCYLSQRHAIFSIIVKILFWVMKKCFNLFFDVTR